MCFAPQRRTLLTSKGAPNSEPLSFFNFWLRNVLRATTACNFLSLIWPHGSAPAALASPQITEKRNVSRLSYLFAHLHLLSSDSLSFSDSSHLCFSIGPYCRKFDFYTSFDNWSTPPFLRYNSKTHSSNCWWTILQLEFPLVRYGPMMSDQVKFRSHLGNPIPALELLQHLPWRWKTNSWLPMLKTRSAVQEAGDGHPGPWCLDFWGATCCFLESGNAGWSWKFANHQRSYG